MQKITPFHWFDTQADEAGPLSIELQEKVRSNRLLDSIAAVKTLLMSQAQHS